MKVSPDGQPAQTRWRELGRGTWRGSAVAWLELSPLTGRTHQLRVHAASAGWPIVGDAIYGDRAMGDSPLQLLARRVEVPISKNQAAGRRGSRRRRRTWARRSPLADSLAIRRARPSSPKTQLSEMPARERAEAGERLPSRLEMRVPKRERVDHVRPHFERDLDIGRAGRARETHGVVEQPLA